MRTDENRVRVDVLLQAVEKLLTAPRPHHLCVISIDGFYGAGKTTFARTLVLSLEGLGKHCLLLSTDDFMQYSRVERQRIRERYLDHPNWYDLASLAAFLKELHSGRKEIIHLTNLYNHVTGELDRMRDIHPNDAEIVVLEGMYALHGKIRSYIDLGILLIADHELLLRRVIYRDKMERNIDEEFVRDRYWIINGIPYQEHLDECIEHAHLVIENSSREAVTLRSVSAVVRTAIDSCVQASQAVVGESILREERGRSYEYGSTA